MFRFCFRFAFGPKELPSIAVIWDVPCFSFACVRLFSFPLLSFCCFIQRASSGQLYTTCEAYSFALNVFFLSTLPGKRCPSQCRLWYSSAPLYAFFEVISFLFGAPFSPPPHLCGGHKETLLTLLRSLLPNSHGSALLCFVLYILLVLSCCTVCDNASSSGRR